MEISLLLILSIIFLVVNYRASNQDFMNPAVIFCLINVLSSAMAVLMKYIYGIDFHWNTLGVLASGMLIFTIVGIISWEITKYHIVYKKSSKKKYFIASKKSFNKTIDIKKTHINKIWILIFVIFELVVAYYRIIYVRTVVRTINGGAFGLAEAIGRYNSIVKNRTYLLRNAGISSGKIYSYGWPLCISFSMVLSVLAIYRKKIEGKLPLLYLLPYAVMIIMSFLSGGRTAAFRYILAFIIQYIFVTRIYEKSYLKGNLQMLRKLIPMMIIILLIMGLSLNFIGRSTKIPLFEYTTAYLGAPLYNLDIFYNSSHGLTSLFGEQTFQSIYSIIGSLFNIPSFIYDLNLPYNRFEGHYLGNVYTMYFAILQDFGYFGVFPLTAIFAGYFTFAYRYLMDFRKSKIGPSLIIYGYLFNDLVMAMFSCKFYETIGSSLFIKFVFFTIFGWIMIKTGYLSKQFKLNKRKRRGTKKLLTINNQNLNK